MFKKSKVGVTTTYVLEIHKMNIIHFCVPFNGE